ncbi:hypothetical protein C7C46_11095 [Streptomyces tateyamensis]|uniref:Uncharacterized protein n=1 Tax=Streptomyces tateyamensis TaxID=565073 RepID=A0A2V4NI21_9ACTN|nr:hypothetical protein [Streptomyces tateyamensis]PYC81761.1 hypothetical protein C7C46_11095 [Streptomyces tateyamensis]
MSSDRAAPAAAAPPTPAMSAAFPPGQSTPYRMTVTTRHRLADAVHLADQCLADWLKQQGRAEPPPDPGPVAGEHDDPPLATRHRLGAGVLLDRDSGPLSEPGPPGRYARRRIRLPETNGAQRITLTVTEQQGGPCWMRLAAEHQPATAGTRTPGRVPIPELAHCLLPLLDALDATAEVRALPRIVTAAEVDAVIDELCDPARRLPTVVASVPADLDPGDWTSRVLHPLLHGVTGLAVGYVLDQSARVVFNTALEYHTVYGGAVRTYLPEVDPASRRDALRHLVLPRHRIEEDPRRAAALLAREPRRLAEAAPLPAPLARVPELRVPPPAQRGAEAVDLAAPREPARPEPLPVGGVEEAGRIRRGLPRAWRRELRPRTESELSGGPLRRVGAQLRSGAGRLCPPGGDRRGPGSFTELLARIEEFPLLSFTGDEKETLALDAHTVGSNWVQLTWDGLTALQEYAVVAVHGEAGGDFKQWCEHAPAGGSHFPPRKAVRGESRTVCSHGKMRRERMFAVPSSVDPSGRAFMGAHLRIGGGRTAPRLHYLDDCSGSGRIYVGYIGMHLTNTMTN